MQASSLLWQQLSTVRDALLRRRPLGRPECRRFSSRERPPLPKLPASAYHTAKKPVHIFSSACSFVGELSRISSRERRTHERGGERWIAAVPLRSPRYSKMRKIPSGSLKDSISFLEMLKKQIDANLQHHKPGECPLTKKDILDLGQLQKEIDFQEHVHAVGNRGLVPRPLTGISE